MHFSYQQKQALTYEKTERVQLGQKAVIYARVSTSDQSCDRQVNELTAFAERANYEIIGVFKETASGTKDNRKERQKIMELAQARKIDAILVSELSRWGRSTSDLLSTLEKLTAWKISVITTSGMALDLEMPQGKMIATVLSGVAQFERDMLSERVKSGLAAAKARGKKLGRQKGQRPKSDHLAPKVIEYRSQGRSCRWIAKDLQISKNTVMAIIKRQNPL